MGTFTDLDDESVMPSLLDEYITKTPEILIDVVPNDPEVNYLDSAEMITRILEYIGDQTWVEF